MSLGFRRPLSSGSGGVRVRNVNLFRVAAVKEGQKEAADAAAKYISAQQDDARAKVALYGIAITRGILSCTNTLNPGRHTTCHRTTLQCDDHDCLLCIEFSCQ